MTFAAAQQRNGFHRSHFRGLLPMFLAALFLVPARIAAHQLSDSYLTLKIEGSDLTGQWDVAIRDLDAALGLDDNGDGAVTWGELKQHHPEIATYVLQRLQVKVNGRALPVRVTEQFVTDHMDGPYAVVRWAAQSPVTPHFLQVDDRIFFDLDPQHRGLFRLEYEGQTQAAIFSAEETTHFFELNKPNRWTECAGFVVEGVWHIWTGFDHILFLIALLLPAVLERVQGEWRVVENFRTAFVNVLRIVTAFTVAHSITLSLATFEIVKLPSRLVESTIAASVVLAALHNFYPVLKTKSWIVAFGFGLIHGFGFANVLGDLGLAEGMLLLALVGFNVGVELGQLVIVSVFLPVAYLLRRSWAYRGLALRFGSAVIVLVAAVWMFERMFAITWLPF